MALCHTDWSLRIESHTCITCRELDHVQGVHFLNDSRFSEMDLTYCRFDAVYRNFNSTQGRCAVEVPGNCCCGVEVMRERKRESVGIQKKKTGTVKGV